MAATPGSWAACLLPIVATAAAAQDAPEPAGGPAIHVTGKKDPQQQKVCSLEIVTGSIAPRRVCKTKAQIEEDHRNAAFTIAEIRREQDNQERMRRAREELGGN